ncbi:zeta toxin family protein [bacterium]|nr:MAG: zeta toxin family protein [bacterium]
MQPPLLVIVCGPNGVGKSSFVDAYVDHAVVRVVNPDVIAITGAGSIRAIAAGREAVERMDTLLDGRESFAVETTLAGLRHERRLLAARERGFRIELFYLGVADVETCLARIARRVRAGGHDVPEADVRRRFPRSMAHLSRAAAVADYTTVFDSGGHGDPARILELAGARLAWAAPMVPTWARRAMHDLLPPNLRIQAPRQELRSFGL